MTVMGPDVLGKLVDTHAAALVLYARQWCAAPEDVVQEAYLKLVRLRQPPREVVPWLYRVVRHAAIDAGRVPDVKMQVQQPSERASQRHSEHP